MMRVVTPYRHAGLERELERLLGYSIKVVVDDLVIVIRAGREVPAEVLANTLEREIGELYDLSLY